MRRFIASRLLGHFQNRYDYDVSYLREMLEATPKTFFRFAKFMGLAQHREATTVDAYFTAKLVGAVSEDCGPCTQLVTDMALEAGVAAAQVEAVLQSEPERLDDDARIAFDFAHALCQQAPGLEAARGRVFDRWGQPGVIELSLTVATSRVFPITKRGMGHAISCQKVAVADRAIAVGGT